MVVPTATPVFIGASDETSSSAQQKEGWGTKVIDRLAEDLSRAFPEITGFSARNLKYMRAFPEAWPNEGIVQQLVAQIPWGHDIRLLDMLEQPDDREWYARQCVEHGWSRSILVHQVETRLCERQGRALTNFDRTRFFTGFPFGSRAGFGDAKNENRPPA
jgi:predicted nuclease of restriction endonuclease-like (RecB) superfamily